MEAIFHLYLQLMLAWDVLQLVDFLVGQRTAWASTQQIQWVELHLYEIDVVLQIIGGTALS